MRSGPEVSLLLGVRTAVALLDRRDGFGDDACIAAEQRLVEWWWGCSDLLEQALLIKDLDSLAGVLDARLGEQVHNGLPRERARELLLAAAAILPAGWLRELTKASALDSQPIEDPT